MREAPGALRSEPWSALARRKKTVLACNLLIPGEKP
jgi:hypothetical protein